ncbi:MAG: hypothetical protein AAF367_01445 [Pseudomonadota bacterium]
MSFFSGFVLGQMTGNKGTPGDAGFGLAGIFAFVAVLAIIGFAVVSFVMPLYAIGHLGLAASEQTGGFGGLIVAMILLALVPVAYVFALFGNRKQFFAGAAGLAFLSFAVMMSLDQFSGSPLHSQTAIVESGELGRWGLIFAAGCVGSLILLRWIIGRNVSAEKRAEMTGRASAPFIRIATSVEMAWIGLGLSALITALIGLILRFNLNRIDSFMDATGRSYAEAKAFVYDSGSSLELHLAIQALLVAMCILFGMHIFRLRKRRDE